MCVQPSKEDVKLINYYIDEITHYVQRLSEHKCHLNKELFFKSLYAERLLSQINTHAAITSMWFLGI